MEMENSGALDTFSPVVRDWFRGRFGAPTPPQALGWLPIQRGENTLILAPTGSGKTLAAFLWGIDELFRGKGETTDDSPQTQEEAKSSAISQQSSVNSQQSSVKERQKGRRTTKKSGEGAEFVRLLYVSPLKALNNDIERNLRVPLEGIRETAARMNQHLPALKVAVRTGDTPASARAAMLKHPPDILITTPESLYLLLTSPKAREMFRGVRTVIVDEIHTLVGNKRGAHLALTLERLQEVASAPIQRIGLSATINPVEEAARFLGGQELTADRGRKTEKGRNGEQIKGGESEDERRSPKEGKPRPVTIVDAHYRKPLELEVVTAVDDFHEMPGESIWASVVPQVLNDIRRHHTTLVFANNRRLAERTADRLNAQLAAEETEEIPPGSPEALAPGGVMRDRGIFAIGAEGPIRAHHGSMSKEARREMEEDLKAGKLPALVGTSSLELGIDIGAVDLVVQLQSPKSVAQGLQRVGRSGHLVGETSRGRIYATFREDLAEAAAIARGMLEGAVEPTSTPQNPLDVLSQQIVAMVAMEDWDVTRLYEVVRRAYPYRDLPRKAFDSVVEMLAGKYHVGAQTSALRARIAWDRVHNRLTALPGSRLLAISNVGTIPDTGAYGVYLGDGKTKVGELDEEFVNETRPGDAFLLGSTVWRATEIKDDRVIVADAAGATPRMPFWRGDYPWRPYELGARIGAFRREIVKMMHTGDAAETIQVLKRDYKLDENSARNLVEYVSNQIQTAGAMSSDETILVESFQNAVGDPMLVVHSPFGGRINGAWALALSSALAERVGVTPETQANDDGIILHFPQLERELPLDIVREMTPAEVKQRILQDLPGSAVFGAQFRMNAARALLLSKPRAGKRTPFWLQRLKAKDLLALVKQFDDFPIITETYRDVLRDVFDMPHLEEILSGIQTGKIKVVAFESVIPSPVAAGLVFNFVQQYLYEWDAPKAERQLQTLSMRSDSLGELLDGVELSDLLKADAIAQVVERAQHLAEGYQARTVEELALYLHELGDLTTDEVAARSAGDGRGWIEQLAREGRAAQIEIGTRGATEKRWVSIEDAEQYLNAFQNNAVGLADTRETSQREILSRRMQAAGPVTREEILLRYPIEETRLNEWLSEMVQTRQLVRGHFTSRFRDEYIEPHLLEQIHRRTMTILRKEVQPVSLYQYADFLARWQHVHPATRLHGEEGTREIFRQLRGVALPGVVWERDVLPARLTHYAPEELDALADEGELVWVGSGRELKRGRVRFFFRGEGALFLPPPTEEELSKDAAEVYSFLKSEGASFTADVQAGTRLSSNALTTALTELALTGLATNDNAVALRYLIASGNTGARAQTQREKPYSALEAELATRRQGARRVTQTQYNEARRRLARHMNVSSGGRARPPGGVWRGRWAPVRRAGVMGPPLADEERAEKYTRALLARYGVVTREALAREDSIWGWGTLYAQFQRMELRGEIRRGYFVAGLAGLQYALPDAVEQLRSRSNGIEEEDESFVVLNATDPANVFGSELGEAGNAVPRLARVPSTYCVLWRGEPVLVAEENGERLTTIHEPTPELVGGALESFFTRADAPRHAVVLEWNGARVAGSAGEALLRQLGFYSMPNGLER